ncbi:MAG: dienelactone hydrolase family protein, partial [bacterium]|nr:dienelactone hydrolase family protein [Actinomycetes bacterium]MCP4965957.1 dienelactone hydrolase family protein [bacterium]MCP5031774.1 dienelactone hydrolase family protein [Actinomycetes bacterium]
EDRQLFLYDGNKHLFADASLPSYDEVAATLLTRRVLDFLNGVG